jgi:hypothetical protein
LLEVGLDFVDLYATLFFSFGLSERLVPCHLHKLFLNVSSPLEEMARVVGPDDEEATVFDESSKLVLLTARQVSQVGEHLEP